MDQSTSMAALTWIVLTQPPVPRTPAPRQSIL